MNLSSCLINLQPANLDLVLQMNLISQLLFAEGVTGLTMLHESHRKCFNQFNAPYPFSGTSNDPLLSV